MTNSTTAFAPDSLIGLAFPVVKVRYAGPTDYRGSRYIATLRGVRHTEQYDHALDGSVNAYNAAVAVWAKYRAQLPGPLGTDEQPRVFIPGDLDADSYSFTVVPAGFFQPGPETTEYVAQVYAASTHGEGIEGDPVKVTRTDYPGAPLPGDRFAWVIAATNGGHMTEPYRDKEWAGSVRDRFSPDSDLAHVALDWTEAKS